MEVLEQHINHHKALHEIYRKALENVEGITVHTNPDSRFDSNYWLTTILIDKDNFGKDCTDVLHHLAATDIESRRLWKPMHQQPVFANAPAYTNGVSDKLFSQGLCLPSGACVTTDEAIMIAETIKNLGQSF